MSVTVNCLLIRLSVSSDNTSTHTGNETIPCLRLFLVAIFSCSMQNAKSSDMLFIFSRSDGVILLLTTIIDSASSDAGRPLPS